MTKIRIKCHKKQAAEHIKAIEKVFNVKRIERSTCPLTKTITIFIKAELKEGIKK